MSKLSGKPTTHSIYAEISNIPFPYSFDGAHLCDEYASHNPEELYETKTFNRNFDVNSNIVTRKQLLARVLDQVHGIYQMNVTRPKTNKFKDYIEIKRESSPTPGSLKDNTVELLSKTINTIDDLWIMKSLNTIVELIGPDGHIIITIDGVSRNYHESENINKKCR